MDNGGSRLEGGFTLLEVVVASAVILVVLLPSAALLATSNQKLGGDQQKLAASNLAAGLLDQDRAAADSQTWPPTLPDTGGATSAQAVAGVTFTLSQSAGWCALSNGVWGSYPSAPNNPASYGVVVTVTWHHALQSLTTGTLFTTPPTVTAPTSGSCPAGI
ncbi:MAG TPA: type II secretion system protein [Acidimicrobiales bacterium]|nr:type II secretion system protein [Acidimicrobiales bacterium]